MEEARRVIEMKSGDTPEVPQQIGTKPLVYHPTAALASETISITDSDAFERLALTTRSYCERIASTSPDRA